ncbi:MAG: prolyl oligopeptidase family serine peptidase [Kiritimatiellaeota bacterium]|nr:prolyl oligopeptidase family serine peptidase [Kiritimatiellota bacterium]
MLEHLYPHMLQEYYVSRVRRRSAARARRRVALSTPEQVRALREHVRARLVRSFGPFPERTPLNARITGSLLRPEYAIEKVMFESRPDFPVTANLYIPRRGDGPFPCVLGACGHSMIGKAAPAYQAFAQQLARQGWVVLLYDPISQGERVQYPLPEGVRHPVGCCQEHNMMGNQMRLIGGFLGNWRVWDGIRGLDYLLSRPETDPERVGVTGNSGGGTLTTYLTAFDDRFTMAAPSCFVTTFLRNLENELPADSEQIPPDILRLGLDMADFFVAHAPRPTLLLGQRNDFFDCRGLREAFDELRRVYAVLGCEDRVRLFIGPGNHGYSAHNRQAMYRFFNEVAGVDAEPVEMDLRVESPEDLSCTPEGQVWKTGQAVRVFDITAEAARRIAARRRPKPADRLPHLLRRVLALPRQRQVPHYRILRNRGRDAPPYAQHSVFAVETEPGIQAICHAFGPETFFRLAPPEKCVVYVPHLSSVQDVTAGETPMAPDFLFAVDVRGIGQTRALTCNDTDFFAPYGNDYFYASYGLMLGRPCLGRRTLDLLTVLDLLAAEGCGEVHLAGRGLGALTAAFAALLHPLVTRVTLKNALLSFYELTQTPVQSWPLSAMAPGQLRQFDLPDCFRALLRKRLRILAPWNSQMEVWDPEALRPHLRALGIPLKCLDREE